MGMRGRGSLMPGLRQKCAATLAWAVRLCVALAAGLAVGAPAYALDPTRSIDQFHHTGWTERDGMPGNIMAITQTADGFLWLGAEGGLYRFDGVRVERIDHFGSTLLPRVSVTALLATPDGDLWIGFDGKSAMASRVRRGALTTFTQRDGLPLGAAKQFVLDSAGGIWLRTTSATEDELTRFDGQSWREIKGDFGSVKLDFLRGVWDFAAAQDGTVWAKNSATLYYHRPGMERFEAAPGYSGRVIGFARSSDGRLWTADQGEQRFYALPDLSVTPEVQFSPPVLAAAVPETLRGNILVDRDGTIWCANKREGGVSRIRSLAADAPVTREQYMAADGLTSNRTQVIFEDREGDIWLGTDRGLDRFRPADVALERKIELAHQSYPRFAWSEDALYIYAGFSREQTTTTAGLSSIYRIAADGKPQIVAADVGDVVRIGIRGADVEYWSLQTEGGEGLVEYRLRAGQKPTRVSYPNNWSRPKGGIDFTDSQDGSILFARPGVGYFRIKDGHETKLISKSDVEEPSLPVWWRGRYWLPYGDGSLYEIDGDQVRKHVGPDIGSMAVIDTTDQQILFGGQLGLLAWDGKEFRTLLASRIPVLATVTAGKFAAGGDLWIVAQAGIIKTTVADLDHALSDPNMPLPYRLFDFRDGLSGAPTANTLVGTLPRSPDGRLWVATAGGLNWIDPNRLVKNDLPPPVAITALAASGAKYEMPNEVRLPPGSSNLQIDYTALSLSIPERNRFRYRLEGVDPDWVDAGDRRQVFYTQLEPRSYRFHVIASNNDGVWNEVGATLAFSIAPTFLQSIWFKILIGLIVAGLAWLAYSLRLRQQAARLQGRFDIRIAERERIARELHDTLLQSIQGLILRFQSIANRVPADSELQSSIHGAIDRADAVLIEGRARVRDLRTTTDDDLSKAILDIADNAIPGDIPDFALTVEGTPRALHALVAEELLRVAGEAIRNAVQHANARTIRAVLSYGRSSLRLTLRDDGAGMSDAILAVGEKQGHYGLIGMRERAKRIGGRLEISSREGAGTEIALTVAGRTAYKGRRIRP